MKHKPKIADVMTADPVSVHTAQPLSEVYDVLQSGGFHHIPVIDGRTPVGMISATDILALVYDIEGSDERMLRTLLDHQFKISDAMSTDIAKVAISANIREVIEPMSTGSLHSVVVVDDEGGLAGIVTSTDLIRLLGDML